MRADGHKNRLAILRAASKIFAEKGFNAPLELIAVEAGVSRATLYRNFDNREQLGLAIFDSNILETERKAAELQNHPNGFLEILAFLMNDFIRDAGLTHVVHRPEGMQHIKEIVVRLLDIIEPLMHEAKADGQIRADYTRDDLELTLRIFGAALPSDDLETRQSQGERLLELILSGITR